MASSVNGFQYRMPTYTLAFSPLDCREAARASAWSCVILRSGEPPPMALYPSELFGARRVDIIVATTGCRNFTAEALCQRQQCVPP